VPGRIAYLRQQTAELLLLINAALKREWADIQPPTGQRCQLKNCVRSRCTASLADIFTHSLISRVGTGQIISTPEAQSSEAFVFNTDILQCCCTQVMAVKPVQRQGITKTMAAWRQP